MYVVYLAGGIASGKSTVACELERLGAWRIDLDQISREVLEPGSELVWAVADTFGHDLVDEGGHLNRRALAERAFATPEDTALLEALELPVIQTRLMDVLSHDVCGEAEPVCCVVEVPLLDRLDADALALADEVVAVTCPSGERLRRAVERGMNPEDAEARMANQPSDNWLAAHADCVIANDGSPDELLVKVRRWWNERSRAGWAASPKKGEPHGA